LQYSSSHSLHCHLLQGGQQQARERYLQERGEWLADEAWMIRSMGIAVTTDQSNAE
jgi:hypothetical protein